LGGTITLSAGHDAAYYTSQMGGPERATSADYYLSATEKLGEPQGTWVGEGLADLGIHDGDLINAEEFEAIYGGFINPRTGEHLGSPPRVNAELRKLFEAKKAAEPGLTRERERELWIEARSEVKSTGAMFWDSTFSVEKTISLAHATALASARKAREAGDLQKAARWDAQATSIWAEIEKAVRVWVSYAQDEARYVRTGHHGRRVEGVEQGRFEDAEEIPVAIFPQHTNRNGDPHLHVHVLWLNRVKTVSDGKWRAFDSRSLHRARGAGSAISHLELETGLTERHGFRWVFRPKAHARVIEGVPEKTIRAFSSRRAEISKTTMGMIEEYEKRFEHEPSRRAVWSMSQHAHRLTREPKGAEKLDFGKLLNDWEATSRDAELGSLTELAHVIWGGKAQAEARVQDAGELSPKAELELMMTALADAQSKSAVFNRETLIHRLGEALPDYVIAKGPGRARQMLEELADRILAGEAGDRVHCVTAGEFPRVPDYLRRKDGESVYRAPGARLYATEAQLTLEQRIIAQAQAELAPHLSPSQSAELLGAELDALEAQLLSSAQHSDAITGSKLTLDQAAVAHHVLSSRRRAEVVVAAAGAGKTFLAGRSADAWTAAGMGRVIGVALSSAARNELAKASQHITAYNSAELFGDLPGTRGARGHADIGRNALILVDEAGVEDLQRYGSLMDLAESTESKIVFLGDHYQLSAPEAGGGLSMFARKLGFAQVTEALRFRDAWQRDASIALRAGDVQALVAYDEHGRLHGGSFEEMSEAAARAYAVDLVAGKDTLLLANSNDESRELSHRVQSYMRDWGKLGSASVRLRENQAAHAGDRIIARENIKSTLLNGDVLAVTRVTERGLLARRQVEREDGSKGWGAEIELPQAYLDKHVDLGYSRTWMTSQGKTVADSAYSLVPSTATRNGAYESLTRARGENHGFFYAADPDCPPDRPEPEVARERIREAERHGEVVEQHESADAVSLASQVLARLDDPMSATETRERSFSSADSLAVLWPMWNDQIRADGAVRYTAELRKLLGSELAEVVVKDSDDLFRALRHAELANLDVADVLHEAVTEHDLTGARSVSAVLAARVRQNTEGIPAAPRDSWVSRVPVCADKDRQDFLLRVAQAMDARQERLGPHVAETRPVWAREALGELPAAGPERDKWIQSAGRIEATREMLGWDHAGRALGTMPGTTSPEFRAEWQNALAAMAKVDGVDVRGLSDGLLLVRRQAFERETSWAPADVGEELRVIRLTQSSARVEAARCDQDATAARRAGREAWAVLHDSRRSDRLAVEQKCAALLADLEPAQQTRREWESVTADTRRTALAADLELKRRGLLRTDEQMKSAEPEGLVPGDLAAEDRDETIRRELGIDSASAAVSARVAELAERSRATQARIDELRTMPQYDDEERDIIPSEAWDRMLGREREALLQPAERYVPPAPEIQADTEVEMQ
jgi:conjugative relaxase-like TrwC/TraI family protein